MVVWGCGWCFVCLCVLWFGVCCCCFYLWWILRLLRVFGFVVFWVGHLSFQSFGVWWGFWGVVFCGGSGVGLFPGLFLVFIGFVLCLWLVMLSFFLFGCCFAVWLCLGSFGVWGVLCFGVYLDFSLLGLFVLFLCRFGLFHWLLSGWVLFCVVYMVGLWVCIFVLGFGFVFVVLVLWRGVFGFCGWVGFCGCFIGLFWFRIGYLGVGLGWVVLVVYMGLFFGWGFGLACVFVCLWGVLCGLVACLCVCGVWGLGWLRLLFVGWVGLCWVGLTWVWVHC